MKRTKLNQPPESVVYTGDFNNDNTIIEVFSYNQKSIKFETYGDADFESEIMEMMDTSNTIWINIIGLNVVETIIKLGEIFGLSLLVLEDIVHVSQRSKLSFLKPFFLLKKHDHANDDYETYTEKDGYGIGVFHAWKMCEVHTIKTSHEI